MRKIILAGFLSSMVFVGCNTSIEKKENNTKEIQKTKPSNESTTADSKVIVFSLANDEDKKKFGALKLDETHENMLDRNAAKESFDVAMDSWVDIHTRLNTHLMNEKFDWGIKDERIKIFNKIYFKADGQVKYYVYRIYANVEPDKIAAYGKIANDFFTNQKIKLVRDVDFAQCGRASLMNSNI